MIQKALAGWISDRVQHRKPLFVLAVLIQAAGVSLLTVGTSVALWIVGQVISGAASALVWATSQAMVLDLVPREKTGRFLGFMSLSLTLAVFLGPAVGGIIYQRAGRFALFGTVYAVIGTDLLLRLLLVEPPRRVLQQQDDAHTAYRGFAATRLLRSPRMISALWAALAQAAILSSFDATLTIYAEATFHWGPEAAGLLYIAFVLPSFASPAVGALSDRFGGRTLAAAGFLVAPAPLVCLRFVQDGSLSDKVLLCALLALISACLATTLPIFSSEVSQVVYQLDSEQPGLLGERAAFAQAGGLWWAAYTLGSTVGPLWGGYVQQAAGWSTMAWSLAILSAATVIPVLLFTP